MSILFGLLTNPTVLGILAAIAAALGWGWKQRKAGAAKERAKREAADRMVEDIADQVEADIGAMTPPQRREALRKMARK